MGKVYASSDWHGCSAVGNKVLDFLQPCDKLYFLGDSIDRGPDGAELFKRLISDKRVIYIKGNHEQLMAQALPFLWGDGIDDRDMWWIAQYGNNWFVQSWDMNGGLSTWDGLQNEPKEQLLKYLNIINEMPLEQIYLSPKGHKVILEHAGYTPDIVYYKKDHDPLWDREHFLDKWSTHDGMDKTYLVHGHTPVQFLEFEYGYKDQPPLTIEIVEKKKRWMYGTNEESREAVDPQILRYCDGHKFDIDLCTAIHNKVALLDLDTFEVIYFQEDN